MYLVQLIYASKVRHTQMADGSIAEIVKVASRNNKELDISGVLYSDGDYFLQTLEGGRSVISELFAKISHDHRHEQVTLLRYQDIHVRDFHNWSMKILSFTQEKMELIKRYSSKSQFDPFGLSAESSRSFLLELARFDR